MTLAAQVFVLPVLSLNFGYFSLVSLFLISWFSSLADYYDFRPDFSSFKPCFFFSGLVSGNVLLFISLLPYLSN